jgi:hypothetical protein
LFGDFPHDVRPAATPGGGISGQGREVSGSMLSMRTLVAFGLVVGLAACAAPASKDTDAVASDAAELKSSLVQYLGTIADGDTKTVSYSSPPKYRSYGFSAKGGDTITIDVKSKNGGDAMAWLTTTSYSTVASNDDASSSTLDSKIVYTVPANSAKKSYRIVFRDYDLLAATFSVKLSIDGPAPGPDPDPSACDPSQEPWRIYKGTPATCATIRYTCYSGMTPFENDCGCGCE